MYYLKYNGIDLTQLVKVRDVVIPSLPSIEHNVIDMWEMDGNIFNSLSYNDREIELTAIIQPLDPNDRDIYVNDVKRAFFVREPQPLFLGDESRYIFAVPEGEVQITELGRGTCELEVTLLAYSPYWINKEVQISEFKGKDGTVINGGDVPTTPIISIGVGGPTTFFQIEKKNTKERILIGELPRTEKETVKAKDEILLDNCQTTSGWVNSTAGIDAGCGTGGTLSVASSGRGICAGAFGSGNDTWKGACYRKSIGNSLKDFGVKVNFSFNSTGMNGDPTRVDTGYKDDIGNATSGSVSYSYTVKVNTTLNIRTGPGTNYKRIGSYRNGTVLTGTPTNGWLKHNYNGQTAYCCMQYLTTNCVDNRTSDTVCNFVTNRITDIRTRPDGYSPSRMTLPVGTVIRCYVKEAKKDDDSASRYRELYAPYNGCYGYVAIDDMTRASEFSVTYELQGETADDKQGKLQVYGFSSSGVQLFSLSVIDDSAWYEATYPVIKKNGKDFLYDVKYNDLQAKTKEVRSNDTVKYEEILSGAVGNWNDFEGELYIERKDDVWRAYIYKYNGKTIESSYVKDSTNGNEKLSYLVIYIGTANAEKPSGMAVNEIQVKSLGVVEPAKHNIQQFDVGDVIEIDCGVPTVKLNGTEANNLVDIGSQFFDLDVGETAIKVASDDNNMTFGVIFNEKYL